MKRIPYDVFLLAGLATVGFVGVIVLGVLGRSLALHLYLLALGALVLYVFVHATREAAPRLGRSSFDAALAATRRPDRPLPELARIEREVTLGVARAFDLHFRLRPILREIALQRVDLDGNAEAARAALGDGGYDLLRSDGEPPVDRYAPGISAPDLRDLVERLERI